MSLHAGLQAAARIHRRRAARPPLHANRRLGAPIPRRIRSTRARSAPSALWPPWPPWPPWPRFAQRRGGRPTACGFAERTRASREGVPLASSSSVPVQGLSGEQPPVYSPSLRAGLGANRGLAVALPSLRAKRPLRPSKLPAAGRRFPRGSARSDLAPRRRRRRRRTSSSTTSVQIVRRSARARIADSDSEAKGRIYSAGGAPSSPGEASPAARPAPGPGGARDCPPSLRSNLKTRMMLTRTGSRAHTKTTNLKGAGVVSESRNRQRRISRYEPEPSLDDSDRN